MITFDRVSKTFPGSLEVVRELSLEVAEGEIMVLLGTSGSGKTTMLKMVNRLIEATSGRILIAGRDIKDQSPIDLRRGIGYAIQHIGLFPHMTVAENIAVVPNLLKWQQDKADGRIEKLLQMTGLDPTTYRDRFPAQLSGGQRQRVGVARALAADPPVVLMDEPFGALDPITREQLQKEFLDLHLEMKKTVIFVTHDVFEAVRMADRIALIDKGVIQQLATPSEMVERPANEFVDQFLGQHRFQLSLLTKTVRSIIGDSYRRPLGNDEYRPPHWINAGDSLIDALDKFKTSRKNILPVYKGTFSFGNFEKSRLLKIMAEVLGDAD
ncbi:ABC transporter ATP-binding protein [Elusimicrobiota bacterium]